MNVYVPFLKRLLTSLLSTFDITSDLINSCDFLGYNASTHIISSVYGNVKRAKEENTFHALSYSRCSTLNKTSTTLTLGNIDKSIAPNISNYILNSSSTDVFKNSTICDPDEVDVHIVWGRLGITAMFAPGLIAILMYVFN